MKNKDIGRESAMVVIKRDDNGAPKVWCDPEISDLVSALNSGDLRTIASCSGHGVRPGAISLSDGREMILFEKYEDARFFEGIWPGVNGEPAKIDVRKIIAERDRLKIAAEKVIEMNRQHAEDQYGDAYKAERWACVMVLREAIEGFDL